ncbi:MAG: ABC transporter permease subunit [Candidatus Lokiarchaeota archaeon]|nr:ABC transporter permease subunit [Candidatus Lokiarchaeota archaeon]
MDQVSEQKQLANEEFEEVPNPLVGILLSIFGAFIGFFKSIGRAIKGAGRWIFNFFKGIIAFIKNPLERLEAVYDKLRREIDYLVGIQLVIVVTVFGLFLVAPLLSVVWSSFFNEYGFTLEYFENIFSSRSFIPSFPLDFDFLYFNESTQTLEISGIDMGAILNSIFVGIATTIISVLLGTFFAFLVARYEFPGKSILRTLLLFPMLSTPFIGAIGIKYFMAGDGYLNQLAGAFFGIFGLGWTKIEFSGLAAIIVVQGLSLFSLVYLNAYSSFMSIDPSLEEQAENLGATGFQLFRSVTLPLAVPGIQAGAILTFILSIEDLGTPIVFAEQNQVRNLLAFQVFDNITAESGTISPIGPAIGVMLLVLSMAGFLAIRKYASLRSYTAGSKGGQWNPRTRTISPQATILLYIIVIPLLFFALIPQISVIWLSLAQYRGELFPPMSLNHYMVLGDVDIQGAITRTLGYAGIATLFCVILGVFAAYIISRKDIPGKTALDMLVTSPIALPGIVIAAGYFNLYYTTPIFPADWPMFLIIMSFTVRKFPFTVRAAFAGLQQTPVALEEASLNMGASKNATFARIVVPLIGVSVLAGGLLSFIYSVSEVSTALILGGANYGQAPFTYWIKEVYEGLPPDYGAGPAAALGVIMMLMQMAVITITNAILKTRASAMTGI